MDDRFFWNKWMLVELIDEQFNDVSLSRGRVLGSSSPPLKIRPP